MAEGKTTFQFRRRGVSALFFLVLGLTSSSDLPKSVNDCDFIGILIKNIYIYLYLRLIENVNINLLFNCENHASLTLPWPVLFRT